MRYLRVMIFIGVLSVSGSAAHAPWVMQQSGTTADLSDVAMLDSVTTIAVGRSGEILRTDDAGKHWTDVSLPLSYRGSWNAISFFNARFGIIAGDKGVVFFTLNGGTTWLWRTLPEARACLSACARGPGQWHVGTDSGWIYKTTDTGKSWSSEKISHGDLRAVFAWRGAYVMGLPLYALTPFSLCSMVEFPTRTRKETVLPGLAGLGSQGFDAEFSNGGGPGYIVGVQGDFHGAPVVLKSSSSDTIWQMVPLGTTRSGELYGVSAPSGKAVYVCGSSGMIFKSSDAGVTWTDQSVDSRRRIRAIFFRTETQGFAVGDSGLILYHSGNDNTSVRTRSRSMPHSPTYALSQHARCYDLKGRTFDRRTLPAAQQDRRSRGVYLTGSTVRNSSAIVHP